MEDDFIDYLIAEGEAVEYGEPWTDKTTYEWWRDSSGKRHCRLVMTYHGGGNRGDDDEAEYVRRLLETGRAVRVEEIDRLAWVSGAWQEAHPTVTHIIEDGKAKRFRYYVPPPEEVTEDGFGE